MQGGFSGEPSSVDPPDFFFSLKRPEGRGRGCDQKGLRVAPAKTVKSAVLIGQQLDDGRSTSGNELS